MRTPSRLKAHAAAVAAWTGVALAVAMYFEPGEARVLVPVLAGAVVAAAIWHGFPASGLVAAIVASAAFGALRYLVQGLEGFTASLTSTTAGLLVLGVLADAFAGRAEADALQRRHDRLLIDELTPTSASGEMKWQHAQRQLADEVGRARRYRYAVSFALIAIEPLPEGSDDVGTQQALRRRSEMVRLLLSRTRSSDRTSFRGRDQLALVLPHTAVSGAVAFLDKNLPEIKVALGTDPRVGVASFPADAGTPEELVSEAESALDFAKASGMRVVSRSLLMGTGEGAQPGPRPRDVQRP